MGWGWGWGWGMGMGWVGGWVGGHWTLVDNSVSNGMPGLLFWPLQPYFSKLWRTGLSRISQFPMSQSVGIALLQVDTDVSNAVPVLLFPQLTGLSTVAKCCRISQLSLSQNAHPAGYLPIQPTPKTNQNLLPQIPAVISHQNPPHPP